jgi:hypothetical protein
MAFTQNTGGQNWAPEAWNLHGKPQDVLESLRIKAVQRNQFSPYEIGVDAGRLVLDQYYAANGDTNKGAAIKSVFSFQGLNNAGAVLLPLGGMIAALGVDYQIFGSAAKGMVVEPLPFGLKAFAVGSLIFAGGLGLTEKFNDRTKKTAMYTTLIVASLGASFLAADSKEFRQKFTNTLATKIDKGSNEDQKKVDQLNTAIEAIDNRIKGNNTRLSTGGVGGKPILADGFPGNDDEGKQILRINEGLEKDLVTKSGELGAAKASLKVSTEQDPVDFYGRIAASTYIGAWLIAAQLLVAEVVRRAGKTYSDFRTTNTKNVIQKNFLTGIVSPDETVRKNAIRSAAQSALSKISEVLSTAKLESGQPDKVNDNFAKLFEEAEYKRMIEVAEEMIFRGIVVQPRRRLIDLFKGALNLRPHANDGAITSQKAAKDLNIPGGAPEPPVA